MVREANPDEFQLAAHSLGVTVDEFGGDRFRRLEQLGQRPGHSRRPIHAHDAIIGANWLAYQ
jgi:hypothetical protein